MANTPEAAERPRRAPSSLPGPSFRDVEQQADEFEEELAAELIRRGVIERW